MTRAGVTRWGAVLAVVASSLAVAQEAAKKKDVSPVLDFTMKNIDGQDVHLGSYQGDVLLLVNVASECGYTPQYDGLEKAFRKYKDRGFKILAFPANNFGAQEPGTDADIKQFCRTKYDVTFDIFSKVSVKGDDKCPLYAYLTDKERNGAFGGEIKWNFQKFLVDRKGQVVARFEPGDEPQGPKVSAAIEKALAEK
jgi:glutathione peroxidase